MEEVLHVWRQWVYGKHPYLPINFVVNLKLLFKKKYLEKNYPHSPVSALFLSLLYRSHPPSRN